MNFNGSWREIVPFKQQDNVKWHKDLYVNLPIVERAGTKGEKQVRSSSENCLAKKKGRRRRRRRMKAN
jgi:hypothetical protein